MMTVLERLSKISNHAYLGGELLKASGPTQLDVVDPATECAVGAITEVSRSQIDDAVARANGAQKGWWQLSALDRTTALHACCDSMTTRRSLLAEALTREMGKPFKESMDEVSWSIHSIRHSAETTRGDVGRVIGNATAGQLHYTLKQPLGVAALIMPFNYPLVLLAWEAGAALAAGNAVIVKPSEYTTLTTLLFAECFERLPAGLFQVLPGGAGVGKHLVEHPETHAIAFTGSIPVGKAVAETCGRLMKRSLIETSGNDPFIVMPSAPLDVAARAAAFSAYMNCGQICTSAERFYVHADVHDAFVERLAGETRKIRIGNGLDKVELGPMVSHKERERFEGVMRKAVGQGARALVGGGRPAGFNRGWFVEPTVLVDCSPDMAIFREESFGPLAPICRVSSFEEALDLANDSSYGLGANIYTTNLSEAMEAAERLQAGMVWVNAPLLDNDAGPFGGTKLSGMGRQLGQEGLDTFRETKLVMIDPKCSSQDFWWFPYADAEMYEKNRQS